ncbi:MAG: GNAT family N-acetyltransferase [Thermoplasmata archaeon]|nr:GNAT family N-acetyltransferase [Thermoplasmata archaeon]
MLRDFQARDIPQLLPLLEQHFPDEQRLLGWRPEVFDRVVGGLYRWPVRFVIGFLALVGKPVYRCFVMEVDGRLAATTLLTYRRRAGFVSAVMVDTPFRRRGYARALLEAAARETRRRHRPYLALDVLVTNTPARHLYDETGFEPLARHEFWVREPNAVVGRTVPASPSEVRPLRRSDQGVLVALAERIVPEPVREVLPIDPSEMFVSRSIVAGLGSASETWVAPRDGLAGGFVRATISEAMESAHLTCPLLAPRLADAAADQLVAAAIAWVSNQGPRRILTEVAVDNLRAREVLTRAGFHVAFALDTLVRKL